MLLFVILANKYGITTYLNFLSIDNLCSIKYKLIWLSELPCSWQQALSYKYKRQSILAQLLSYLIFLSSGNFVVPNLSHSDYLNLPVTVDKLLATKKKRPELILHI